MSHVEVKTTDLTDKALDWAVAKAIELPVFIDRQGWVRELPDNCSAWRPAWNWSQGGPLIEKYIVQMEQMRDGRWCADTINQDYSFGDTPLIAACRAIVALKMGDTVEVPAELVEVADDNQ